MLLLVIVFALLLVVGLQLVRGLMFRGMGGWGRPYWGGWFRGWGGLGWGGGMRGYSWPPDGPRGHRYDGPREGFAGPGGPGPDGRDGRDAGGPGMRP
ncbi:MAG: hypothetical protein LKF00_09095 [Olsenella sp.]|jgi:hypothetical protein|nr:hypothetical protein [Olsenella sp.]MCI1289517.1 hypothetical protein [Olsenella sp.]